MTGDVLALFGHPVGHSRSPAIHAAFAAQFGRDIDYRLIDVEPAGFPAAVDAFFTANGAGANVTLPHKAAAAALCDLLSPEAQRAGAVNTLWRRDGRLHGHNSDGIGLRRDLEANLGLDLHGGRILICGAGGAAHGILGPLLERGPREIVIANRTVKKAETLAATDPRCRGCGYDELAGQRFSLVLNATSTSLQRSAPPLPDALFTPQALAYDLVYADSATPFMAWAAAHGAARIADGWGMLVEQAAESYACWFNERPATASLLARRLVIE